ncbi:hypothetical protein [Arthrobacter sp. NPDC057013]|uniref:hypothetical protein n=1 Tax=Arthrobacter sp. NPDC057013 TaxID=3345999 RepID=UPI00362A3D15
MPNHALPAPTPGQDSAEQGSGSRGLQDPTPAALPVTERRVVGLALRPVMEAAGAPDAAPSGGVISRQIQRLILEILTDANTDEQVRLGLLRQMAAHPGDTPGAMLAHLRDVADRSPQTGP